MVRISLTLIMLAGANAAAAQPPGSGAQASPEVTVRAPERLVCRAERRTATRMRTSRVCRPVSQLRAEEALNQDEELAEAADRLEVIGRGLGVGDNQGGPLGPR